MLEACKWQEELTLYCCLLMSFQKINLYFHILMTSFYPIFILYPVFAQSFTNNGGFITFLSFTMILSVRQFFCFTCISYFCAVLVFSLFICWFISRSFLTFYMQSIFFIPLFFFSHLLYFFSTFLGVCTMHRKWVK